MYVCVYIYVYTHIHTHMCTYETSSPYTYLYIHNIHTYKERKIARACARACACARASEGKIDRERMGRRENERVGQPAIEWSERDRERDQEKKSRHNERMTRETSVVQRRPPQLIRLHLFMCGYVHLHQSTFDC